MKIKHIVAIRILCTDMPGRERLFTDKNVEYQADFCRRHTAASIANSVNKSFDVVFLMHDTRPMKLFLPFIPVAADLCATLVRWSDFPRFCEKYRGDSELIVTRTDADDCFANWLVDDVQNMAASKDAPFIYGYNRGLLYRSGSRVLRLHNNSYVWGFFSCFQSLVYKRNDRFRLITPYSWQHQDIRKGAIPNLSVSDRNLLVCGDRKEPAYIYMRNGMQASHDDSAKNDERFQPCSDRFSRGYIKKVFGVDLDF